MIGLALSSAPYLVTLALAGDHRDDLAWQVALGIAGAIGLAATFIVGRLAADTLGIVEPTTRTLFGIALAVGVGIAVARRTDSLPVADT